MLSRIRRRTPGPPPDRKSVNFTVEHVTVSKTIARRKKVFDVIWKKIPLIRVLLAAAGLIWLLAIPYEGLWKGTYVDEHALQPGQVKTYFDWGNVHKADLYLDKLEKIVNGTFEERSTFIQDTLSASGLSTSNTSTSTYAHVKPPRSKGTESILVSANWISRDGTPNLRGVATLLALGNFLKGQNHWAFDFILVIGEGYTEGLEGFMREYHTLFNGVIWTGLNIDYPGHSFSHIGLFYEGVNGRLPNQDIVNTVQRVAQFTGGVPTRYHDIPDEVPDNGPQWLGKYLLASKHLLSHFGYMITGRASAAHGVLARHRIDSLTLYCTPSTGPHGFHTLGRTLESSLRSMNNLLERLHASYFFYLLPRPWNFIPIGHYLPSAILLSASLTIGGFDIPEPLGGLFHILPGFAASFVYWVFGIHPVLSIIFLGTPFLLNRVRGRDTIKGTEANEELRKSSKGLLRLLYGSLIATLSMINFPQSIFLAFISLLYLNDYPKPIKWVVLVGTQPGLVLLGLKYLGMDMDLAKEWVELGNLTYPLGVCGIWGSLWINSVTLLQNE